MVLLLDLVTRDGVKWGQSLARPLDAKNEPLLEQRVI
jgi:hypothetical protein